MRRETRGEGICCRGDLDEGEHAGGVGDGVRDLVLDLEPVQPAHPGGLRAATARRRSAPHRAVERVSQLKKTSWMSMPTVVSRRKSAVFSDLNTFVRNRFPTGGRGADAPRPFCYCA